MMYVGGEFKVVMAIESQDTDSHDQIPIMLFLAWASTWPPLGNLHLG
jgi:hypothetical protein